MANMKGGSGDDADEKIQEGEDLIQPLAEDHDTPFSPPTDPIDDPSEELDIRTQDGRLSSTHPSTDTDIDQDELYDEGLSGAAEAEEPNPGNAVIDYNPAQVAKPDDDEGESGED